MRIGFITDNYFPARGGTEISIHNFKQCLEQLGHEVFVFCPNYPDNELSGENDKNIIRLPSFKLTHVFGPHPTILPSRKLIDTIRSYELDIIHSQTPHMAPYIARVVANKLSVPHIHTIHTFVPAQIMHENRKLFPTLVPSLVQTAALRATRQNINKTSHNIAHYKFRLRIGWRHMLTLAELADHVIFPSAHTRSLFRQAGFNGSTSTLPTFTRMFDSFKIKPKVKPSQGSRKAIRVITVGRLDPEKRTSIILNAVKLLPKDLNWKLLIVGDGSERKKLEARAKSLNLKDKVKFIGSVTQKQVAKSLRGSDIFVLASFGFDTQGLVLLEAAHAGLPIIYCDPNLNIGVSVKNSILTSPDEESIAQAITKLIKNDSLRIRLGNASLKEKERYSPSAIANRLINIYTRIRSQTSKSS